MRRVTPLIWLIALLLVSAPGCAAGPSRHEAARVVTVEVERRPANDVELAGYAAREQQARKLERFEGGRGGGGTYIGASTLIIILLVVILVVIIV